LAEVDDLVGELIQRLPRSALPIVPFRVHRRPNSQYFPKDRAGWYIGSSVASIGHGDMGHVPIWLLSTGRFIYYGATNPRAVHHPCGVEFFDDYPSSTRRLEQLEELLRGTLNKIQE